MNQIVAIGGVGISVASLAASTFTDQAKDIIATLQPVASGKPVPVEHSLYSTLLGFGVSLAIGLFAALLTYLVFKVGDRR